jgi:ribonuclease III
MDDARRRERIERLFDYRFKNAGLLRQALIHASQRRENGECNERLEFLGDAVLGLVVTGMLYRSFPEADEGELTRLKGTLVSRRTLAILGRELKLGPLIVTGPGFSEPYPDSLLANVFEALMGAWYLDSGLLQPRKWLRALIAPRIEIILANRHERNHKSILQQFCQKIWKSDPFYQCTHERGPAHERLFTMAVHLGDELLFIGEGSSRKQAEQKAAASALRALRNRRVWREILGEISG